MSIIGADCCRRQESHCSWLKGGMALEAHLAWQDQLPCLGSKLGGAMLVVQISHIDTNTNIIYKQQRMHGSTTVLLTVTILQLIVFCI